MGNPFEGLFETGDVLERVGIDVTAQARRGDLEPVRCRDAEIARVVDILLRQGKNNAALVGRAGVGKTAVVEGLAQRIATGDVPPALKDARVLQLDHVSLLAGTSFRGQYEERLRRLVKDLQQMSLLESGHAPLDLAPLDMYTLAEETLNVIQPECEQMGISLHNDIAPALPTVFADSDRITEVLLNLLDNARHHTPTGGSIHIGGYTKEDNLYIRVSDTGTGIAPEDLPHIFERFYRADRSRVETSGGSGLGLSIVKAIITAHKGAIWAESEVGHGTCITFTLPLARLP